MYLAHTGAAMAVSPSDPDAPVYAFLLATWSPDLTGVGHWLPGGALLAALFFVAARRRWNDRVALALALLVVSHLVLDLVVGLQIWPEGRFLGLNLSTHSVLELVLELVVICGGFAIYISRRRPMTTLLGLAFGVTVAFAVIAWSFADDPDVHDPAPARLGVQIAGLLLTSVLLIAADRQRGRPTVRAST